MTIQTSKVELCVYYHMFWLPVTDKLPYYTGEYLMSKELVNIGINLLNSSTSNFW